MHSKKLSILLLGLLSASPLAADYARFSERLYDRNVCTRDPETRELFCEQVPVNTATFSASLTVPGLAAVVFDDSTILTFSVGGFGFEQPIGEAGRITANSATFYQTEENPDTLRIRRIGSITFSRRGNILTVSGSSSALESSIVAGEALGMEDERGNISGETTLNISAAGLIVEKRIYYKGRNSKRRIGPVEEEMFLNNITLTGSADFTNPTTIITTPRSGARIAATSTPLGGTARDNIAVGQVLYQVNSGEWTEATLVAPETGVIYSWSGAIDLSPLNRGRNIIKVKAVDVNGNEMRPLTRIVTRTLP